MISWSLHRRNDVLAKSLAGGLVVLALTMGAWAQDHAAPAPAAPTPVASKPGSTMTPVQRVDSAAKGTLKNAYTDDNADIVAQGSKLYLQYSCNGCHGGNGGGGICPPLINDVWIYDGDDDTLFRLVTLGSVALQAKGYVRKGHENVVAPMPPFGTLIPTEDDLWKIMTFVRASFKGSPSRKYGNPPPTPEPTQE
jgi:mono/diheme cytochrome c family protein